MSALAIAVAAPVSAQSTIGVKQMVNPVIIPQTTVHVTLTVKREHIAKGPYAKYAQQYLGIAAPLNDKTTYTILGAELSWSDRTVPAEATPLAGTKPVADSGINKPLFSDVSLDPIVYTAASGLDESRMSVKEKSLDRMAADAADAIFTLRRRRFDLVTGEFGENVFGAGLPAAIEEMARIEDNYLSLFTGKKNTYIYNVTLDVTPAAEPGNTVVCRFSETGGVVDRSDLSGEPIMLNITAGAPYNAIEGRNAGKSTVYLTLPRIASCKLFNGMNLLTEREIPMLQSGTVIEAVNAR